MSKPLHRNKMPAVQIMRRRYLLLLPIALFGSGCAAPGPRVEPVTVTVIAVAEPLSATKPVASVDAPSDPASAPCEEGFTALYLRFEASPRSPAFDAAARAFDRATARRARGPHGRARGARQPPPTVPPLPALRPSSQTPQRKLPRREPPRRFTARRRRLPAPPAVASSGDSVWTPCLSEG